MMAGMNVEDDPPEILIREGGGTVSDGRMAAVV
jgi:hypothetical protein